MSSPTTRCYSITGVVDPLPTAAELYGSDDTLPHNLGLKGAAAKAAAAAAFPTPLYMDVLTVNESVYNWPSKSR